MTMSFPKTAFVLGTLMATLTPALSWSAPAAAPASQRTDTADSKPPLKLDINDLGFAPQQSTADAEVQQTLNRRSTQLQYHQILGLVTLGLMTATYFTAPEHKAASVWHRGFAAATGLSYATTAALSLTAPEVPGMQETGWNIRLHKTLMWVHLPGMILTPIAGILAQNARRAGKEPSGLGKYKGALANITYFSYTAAALTMVINF